MSILWLIIKVALSIVLSLLLASVFILFLLLLVPIHYDCLFEKYDESYCHLQFSFLSILKAKLLLKNNVQTTFVRLFGKTIYKQPIRDFKEVAQKNAEKTANKTQKVSEAVIKEESEERLESEEGTTRRRVIKDLVLDERFFRLLKDILVMTKRLLEWISPHRIHFELVIGKRDPGETGELIALLTLFYPWYYKYGIIEGSYDEEGLWGECYAVGKLRLVTLIKIVILFIWNKEAREYIQLLLKTRKEA